MRSYVLLGLLLTVGVAYCVLNDEIRIVRIIRGADDSSKSSEEKSAGTEDKADSGELKAVKEPAAVDTAVNLESSGEAVVPEPTIAAVVEEGSGADETFFPQA